MDSWTVDGQTFDGWTDEKRLMDGWTVDGQTVAGQTDGQLMAEQTD